MMVPLSAQKDLRDTTETEKKLAEIKTALLGFAAANGRLPCPASPVSTGVESPSNAGSGVACTNPWDGFLPAVTLGIAPTNDQGYAIDSWGNPIHYAVTSASSGAFTKTDGIKTAWPTLAPDLRVCSAATGISGSGGSAECASGTTLANTAVAVIFSRGKNGGTTPTSADEVANGDTDRLFVSRTPTAEASANPFDDIVTWTSPNILYDRLISTNRLP